jgi:hypothetical protein
MKIFLKNIFIYILLLLFLNFFIFHLVDDLYFSNYIFNDNSKYSTFLLADSHGDRLKNYLEVYGIKNLSTPGDSYLDFKRKIISLRENNVKIDNIILTADRHTLSKYRDNLNNHDRSIRIINKPDKDSHYYFWINKYFKYYIPLLNSKARDILKNYVFKNYISNNKKIWSDFNNLKKEKMIKSRLKQQFGLGKSKVQVKYLIELIDYCSSNNINIIGLRFPITNQYYNKINKIDYGAMKIIQDNGFIVKSFDTKFLNNDEYFQDQDHLNDKGAKEFSKLFGKIIK